MSVVFIANVEYSTTEGIYKKVQAQAVALSNVKGECILLSTHKGLIIRTRFKQGIKVKDNDTSGTSTQSKQSKNLIFSNIKHLHKDAIRLINTELIDTIYIRHMIPIPSILNLLSIARKQHVIILYEIPTYPYYGEQLKSSKHVIKTIIRLLLDTIFWPMIYYYINRLIIIKSNSQIKTFKKMRSISNGIDTANIKNRKFIEHDDKFCIVGVGTIYKYHGYDRIIYGIRECNGIVQNKKVEFHIIGESKEIENLKDLAFELDVEDNVVFHKTMNKEELNVAFDTMDVGAGCLELYRRNADIDTTLKVIEYFVRGLPVITSGMTPRIDNIQMPVIAVSNTDEKISIEQLYKVSQKYKPDYLIKFIDIAKKYFDWNNIFNNIFNDGFLQ